MNTDTNGQPAPPAAPAAPPAAKQTSTWSRFKPFLAPILITCILAGGSLKYGVFEGHGGTAVAIVASIIAETLLSLFATGRWPHIASAYITGISVGILVRSPLIWPYIMCSLLSITSKYALRVGGRHLWNPSNLGVSMLLFLAPDAVAPLSQQWGNEFWVLLIIGCLGCLILYSLGRIHITLTYIVAFTVLSFVRVGINRGDWSVVSSVLQDPVTRSDWISQIALLTAPAYQLFMFFMITDPRTTPRTKLRQILVTVIVAIVETLFRLGREIHAPYYALFVVFPITNLFEIYWDRRQAPARAVVAGTPSAGVSEPGRPPVTA
jgi:Na+-transporting NADH:ubiquinone oxidoreductase subunit NqrB